MVGVRARSPFDFAPPLPRLRYAQGERTFLPGAIEIKFEIKVEVKVDGGVEGGVRALALRSRPP